MHSKSHHQKICISAENAVLQIFGIVFRILQLSHILDDFVRTFTRSLKNNMVNWRNSMRIILLWTHTRTTENNATILPASVLRHFLHDEFINNNVKSVHEFGARWNAIRIERGRLFGCRKKTEAKNCEVNSPLNCVFGNVTVVVAACSIWHAVRPHQWTKTAISSVEPNEIKSQWRSKCDRKPPSRLRSGRRLCRDSTPYCESQSSYQCRDGHIAATAKEQMTRTQNALASGSHVSHKRFSTHLVCLCCSNQAWISFTQIVEQSWNTHFYNSQSLWSIINVLKILNFIHFDAMSRSSIRLATWEICERMLRQNHALWILIHNGIFRISVSFLESPIDRCVCKRKGNTVLVRKYAHIQSTKCQYGRNRMKLNPECCINKQVAIGSTCIDCRIQSFFSWKTYCVPSAYFERHTLSRSICSHTVRTTKRRMNTNSIDSGVCRSVGSMWHHIWRLTRFFSL